jgi:hypothetical protein
MIIDVEVESQAHQILVRHETNWKEVCLSALAVRYPHPQPLVQDSFLWGLREDIRAHIVEEYEIWKARNQPWSL